MATLPFWLMGRAFRKVCNMAATLGHNSATGGPHHVRALSSRFNGFIHRQSFHFDTFTPKERGGLFF